MKLFRPKVPDFVWAFSNVFIFSKHFDALWKLARHEIFIQLLKWHSLRSHLIYWRNRSVGWKMMQSLHIVIAKKIIEITFVIPMASKRLAYTAPIPGMPNNCLIESVVFIFPSLHSIFSAQIECVCRVHSGKRIVYYFFSGFRFKNSVNINNRIGHNLRWQQYQNAPSKFHQQVETADCSRSFNASAIVKLNCHTPSDIYANCRLVYSMEFCVEWQK